MKSTSRALGCLFVLLTATRQPTWAEENRPGGKMSGAPSAAMHLLDPVSITDKDHLAGKGKRRPMTVGDKALIQIEFDPKTTTVELVDVKFGNRALAACEIVQVPQKPAKKGEAPVAVVGVVVRAVEAKAGGVVVVVKCKDGSALTLYFTFDIKAKP